MEESPKRGLLAAYRRLLGPLVRILIRNGVTFDEFTETARKSFVEVAGTDFAVTRGEEETHQNRIAILTGLEKSKVEEIWAELASPSDSNQNFLDICVKLLHAWHTDANFTGPYGIPLELNFDSNNKGRFVELCEKHTPSIEPKVLLDELAKVGAVVETEKDWFKVLVRGYEPKPESPAGLEYLTRTVSDLVRTLDHNILEKDSKKKLIERHVYTEEGIRPEDLPRFAKFASEKANLLLYELDDWLSKLEGPDEFAEEKISTGIGIFHYVHQSNEQDK